MTPDGTCPAAASGASLGRRGLLAASLSLPMLAGLGAARSADAAPAVGASSAATPPGARPFRADLPRTRIEAVLARVRQGRAPDRFEGASWDTGPDPAWMRAFVARWAREGEAGWRRVEARFNHHPQLLARVGGEDMHVFRVGRPGGGTGRRPPLVLLHGWPHNAAAFLGVLDPLAYPERHGGDAADAFEVVVPSYPGTGFSQKPARPVGPMGVAGRVHELLTRVLGHERYLVQGGDWGSWVGTWLARAHPDAVAGLHLNHAFVRQAGAPIGSGELGDAPDASEAERAFVADEKKEFAGLAGAYFWQQAARPDSLAWMLAGDPVGSAAWYLDKFYLWCDRRKRPFGQVLPEDALLEQVWVNAATGTDATATWIYRGFAEDGRMTLDPGERIRVPTAFAAFPDPFNKPPPRRLVERAYDVVRWTPMEEGGHWPMLERPDLYVADVRAFARELGL